MKRLFERLKDFLFFAVVGVYWGFIGGLIASMAAFTMRYCPFWCLGFTGFFVLFHLSDFKKFYLEKNWLAFSGRLISLFAITAFLVSIFALAFGGFSSVDIFDALGFLTLMTASIFLVTFWILLKQYGNQTRVYKELEKIVDGLYVLGVFWKN
jgi:hypothetical protein